MNASTTLDAAEKQRLINYYLESAHALGYDLIEKKATVAGLNINANNIARMIATEGNIVNPDKFVTDDMSDVTQQIDALTTLYAIKYTKPNTYINMKIYEHMKQ